MQLGGGVVQPPFSVHSTVKLSFVLCPLLHSYKNCSPNGIWGLMLKGIVFDPVPGGLQKTPTNKSLMSSHTMGIKVVLNNLSCLNIRKFSVLICA